MIPLNISSLVSNGCSNRPSSAAEKADCREDTLDREGRAKRVRFADDDIRNRLNRGNGGRRREDRKRPPSSKQTIGGKRRRASAAADENKRRLSRNLDWMDSNDFFTSARLKASNRIITSSQATTNSEDDDEDDEDDDNEMSTLRHSTVERGTERFPSIPIPDDPRLWSRLDVYNWLEHMKSREHDLGDLDTGRFLMNGKALCLMTPAMFVYRVPRGGKLLYKDFQTRLCRAIAVMHHNNLI